MVTGFSGPLSKADRSVQIPRHRCKEASVARRGRTGNSTLEVRITFEPSRVSPVCVAQAYERVVPITRRPTPQTLPPRQDEGARQMQHVGGRQPL